MLKNISSCVSPELLMVLSQMGHGEELLLADAHFPTSVVENAGGIVLRADGVGIEKLLNGILPLYEIDSYVDDPIVMMAAVPGDELDPTVEEAYLRPINKHAPSAPEITRIGRFEFYDRAKTAYAVVLSGELAKYGNIIIKKGVTPITE